MQHTTDIMRKKPLRPAGEQGGKQYRPLKTKRVTALTAHSSKLPGCELIRLSRRVDRKVGISWRRKPPPQGAKASVQQQKGRAGYKYRHGPLTGRSQWVSQPPPDQLSGQEAPKGCSPQGPAAVAAGSLGLGAGLATPGIVHFGRMHFPQAVCGSASSPEKRRQ